MAERADFWKGMVTGTLAGMVIAAYSQWDLRWMTRPSSRDTNGATGRAGRLDLQARPAHWSEDRSLTTLTPSEGAELAEATAALEVLDQPAQGPGMSAS
jgi:hypothetical protein